MVLFWLVVDEGLQNRLLDKKPHSEWAVNFVHIQDSRFNPHDGVRCGMPYVNVHIARFIYNPFARVRQQGFQSWTSPVSRAVSLGCEILREVMEAATRFLH